MVGDYEPDPDGPVSDEEVAAWLIAVLRVIHDGPLTLQESVTVDESTQSLALSLAKSFAEQEVAGGPLSTATFAERLKILGMGQVAAGSGAEAEPRLLEDKGEPGLGSIVCTRLSPGGFWHCWTIFSAVSRPE